MAKVLGLGNALVDIMTRIESDSLLQQLSLPKGSMQIVNADFMKTVLDSTHHFPQTIAAGGSAANTIHGLANLGVETSFIGKIGKDAYGTAFESDMVKNGIKPIMLKGASESGRALALVSTDSERTFAVYLGAAIELTAEDITPEMFDNFTHFHIEGYLVQNHSLIKRAVEIAKSKGLVISLDMASYNVVEENREFLRELITNYVNIVFANEEEAKSFTGLEPEDAVEEFARIADIAVVKMGHDGSIIKKGEVKERVGIIDVNSIDTTGAGDLYASGFLYGLIKGLNLRQCGKIGAILSGHVIEVLGPKMDAHRWLKAKEYVDKIEKEL